MHGYDLRKRLRSRSGVLASLSYGSLYPALARLERAGAVREVQPTAAEGEPLVLTGSLSGEMAAFRARLRAAARGRSVGRPSTRGRRVYELTDAGDQTFAALLAEEGGQREDDSLFKLRWSFAGHLSEEARLQLLERQRRRLEDRIALATKELKTAGSSLDQYARQLAEHSLDSLHGELHWIASLIAAEDSATMSNEAGGRPGRRRSRKLSETSRRS